MDTVTYLISSDISSAAPEWWRMPFVLDLTIIFLFFRAPTQRTCNVEREWWNGRAFSNFINSMPFTFSASNVSSLSLAALFSPCSGNLLVSSGESSRAGERWKIKWEKLNLQWVYNQDWCSCRNFHVFHASLDWNYKICDMEVFSEVRLPAWPHSF